MDGVIVVDKPAGWTSHDAVNKVRQLAGTKRVGHLGTLDPLATGVLPLVVGRATRLAQFFFRNDKVYEGVIRFGYSTDTYDDQGTPTSPQTDVVLDSTGLEGMLDQFRGSLQQVPPPISAKKVAGTPAYRLARKKIAVVLKPVDVTVFSLVLVRCEGSQAHVRVHCSAGTYVRGIAHDLGQRMGCGAFLQSLRRIASGDFTVDHSRSIEELRILASEGRLADCLIPAAKLLPEFPSEMVDALTAGQIRHGRDFRVSPFRQPADARFVKAVTREGDLVAIGEARLPNLYHPILVL